MENPLSIFDHIPQAECLLPQESFGIENDVLETFSDISCQTSNFASTVSIKIGTSFIQISRRRELKLPEKQKKSSEGGSHAKHSEDTHAAQLSAQYTLNDAIPRKDFRDLVQENHGKPYKESGQHELQLFTKHWLLTNLRLRFAAGDQRKRLIEQLKSSVSADEHADDTKYSGLLEEEYLSKILVVSLMGLSDRLDSVRTESQCLLCCIFRRLGVSGGAGAGPAFVHTIMSCPPSNMNRLILDISTRIAKSDPRLARPFLEYSFDQIELSSSKESVNLQ